VRARVLAIFMLVFQVEMVKNELDGTDLGGFLAAL